MTRRFWLWQVKTRRMDSGWYEPVALRPVFLSETASGSYTYFDNIFKLPNVVHAVGTRHLRRIFCEVRVLGSRKYSRESLVMGLTGLYCVISRISSIPRPIADCQTEQPQVALSAGNWIYVGLIKVVSRVFDITLPRTAWS